MRFISLTAAAVLVALTVLTGCNSKEGTKTAAVKVPSQAPAQVGDGVRRITPEELKAEIARNDVVIVDVRGEPAYKQGHIKGARLIPATEILAHVDELPRDKMIVTYCS
jgi:predicted sulfurtransferase